MSDIAGPAGNRRMAEFSRPHLWWRLACLENAISCGEDRGGAGGRCSSLRQPRLAHPVADALALSQIGRIVARRPRVEAGDGESGIEGKPGLNRGPRLIEPAKMR